jgi:RimJ/RimL family protein N-acetyltransferase
LHALASQPAVYRYLFDAAPPDREFLFGRLAESITNAVLPGLGMWVLENAAARYAGCVELRTYPLPRTAELAYFLDPANWGQGLAVRMAWTAITGAFLAGSIDAVVAGADLPNSASFAVMRRLGMRFHKSVQYPLGAGAEYVLHRGSEGALPQLLVVDEPVQPAALWRGASHCRTLP